jgi:hypothetical protein
VEKHLELFSEENRAKHDFPMTTTKLNGNLVGTAPRLKPNFTHDCDLVYGKEEWLTPPTIIEAFGPFDLDPCAPVTRPWETATNHFTILDDGLARPWQGFVWCNPPYGPKTRDWLAKCAAYNNCLALVFARTDTHWFQNHVWPHATSLFFIKGRLSFYHVGGEKGGTAGAPSVLIAYGALADQRLRENKIIAGHYLQNQPTPFNGLRPTNQNNLESRQTQNQNHNYDNN